MRVAAYHPAQSVFSLVMPLTRHSQPRVREVEYLRRTGLSSSQINDLHCEGEETSMTAFKRIAVVGLALVLAIPTIAFAQGSGADVFKAKCAMCHGADGSASTGMGKSMGLKPLSSPEVQKMSDADMTALIANGKGKMPASKGKLSDADIAAVVKYVKTMK